MRRVKRIALWGLALLILSAAVIVVFLATAGDGFYRWAARHLLEGAIDRQVHIEGTFSLDVGLEPSLAVTEIWIENAPWAEKKEMARIGRAEVQIALKPLIAGIVRIPRLVVEDLTLALERGPDGTSNWDVAKPSGDAPETVAQEKLFIPLFELISLRRVAVTYRDRQGGRDKAVYLESLERQRIPEEAGFALVGQGNLNRTGFQIGGRFGSIEEALAATAPYPFELTLEMAGLVAEITGTARNLPEAEGFDIGLSARAPSIARVLETLDIAPALEGRAKASARMRGDLASLAIENLAVEFGDEFGQELRAEGSLSDLPNGKGLDLRFTAQLGPEALPSLFDPPRELQEILTGAERLSLAGRITGDLEAPEVEELEARLEHVSGADLALRGQLAFALSKEGTTLTALQSSAVLSLPDPALLQQALRAPLPEMGAIRVTSELALEGDWIRLSALEMEAPSFAAMRLSTEGRLARLSGKGFDFAFDPLIDITASTERSREVIAFLAEPSNGAKIAPGNRADSRQSRPSDVGPSGAPTSPPSRPPPRRSGNEVVLSIQQGLRSLGFDPGPLDGLMGPRTRAAIQAYQAQSGLAVDGRASEGLLQRLQREAGIGRPQGAPGTSIRRSRERKLVSTLPELGPFRVSARLSQSEGTYRLGDVRLTLGRKKALWVEASGALGTLSLGSETPLEELTLRVSFALPSSKMLSEVFPPDLPEVRRLRGRFDVQGSLEALSISGARIEAEGPNGLTGTARGRIASLSLLPVPETKGVAFDLEAQSPSTKSVLDLVDLSLPELGEVRARANLRDRGNLFALTNIDVSAGPSAGAAVHVVGQVGDLLAMKHIKLSGDFQIATETLLRTEVPVEGSALGRVHGRFDLSDSDGSLGIEALSAEVKDTQLLSLSVQGVFDDIRQKDQLRFLTSLNVPNVAELGRALGFEANHVSGVTFTGELAGDDERFQAEGKGRIGETDLSITLTGSLVGERPALRAIVYSPAFHLADIGFLPDLETAESPEKKEIQDQRPAPKLLFSDEPLNFEALKKFDLDLDVQLDDVKGIDLEIDEAEARLDIVDGVLTVDPLLFNFVGGRIEIRLLADARGEDPEVTLDIVADDVDLGDFLAQVETEVPLDGELDMVVHLRAAGHSPRMLAARLDGELDLAIARGHMRTSLLDLTVTNPVSWMFSRSARRGYSDLNCLVVRFDFEEGIAKSDTLLLDTTNVRAQGSGDIDFRDENLDIDVAPRAKRRRLVAISTPFEIEGPLTGISVRVSTTGAATRMAAKTLFSPLNWLGSLLPFVNDRGRDAANPCLSLQDRTR